MVAVDVDEPAELVAPYLAELGLTFPVGLDVDGQVADTYRIGTYPTTYLPVSYTHLRAHETVLDILFRLLLAKKKNTHNTSS